MTWWLWALTVLLVAAIVYFVVVNLRDPQRPSDPDPGGGC